jgi:hypothetical protein
LINVIEVVLEGFYQGDLEASRKLENVRAIEKY